jgi:hypothetical protein
LSGAEVSAGTGRRTAGTAAAPVYVQLQDPMALAFGAMALAGFGVLLFGAFVLISALVGTHPGATAYFATTPIYMPIVFGLGLVIVLFIIGAIVGRMGRR